MKVAFSTGGLLIIAGFLAISVTTASLATVGIAAGRTKPQSICPANLPPVLQGWQTAFLTIPCLQGIAAPSAVPEMLLGFTTASAADLPFDLSDTFLLHRAAGIVTAMLTIQAHGYDPFQFSSGGS